MNELTYKVFVTRRMVNTDDRVSLHQAEGERVHRMLSASDSLGIIILNDEFQLTVDRVKRFERLLGSIFEEKVDIIY